jgi:hypothetical protein
MSEMQNSLYINVKKLKLMRFPIWIAVVENSLYIMYYKDNINALSNKDGSTGKLIVY